MRLFMRPGKKTNKTKQQPNTSFCGWLVWLLKWSFIVISLLVLLLSTGVFTKLGMFTWIDSFESSGNFRYKGMAPFIHHGQPRGFHLDELKNDSLEGQVMVVTGANTGLGYSSAVALASKGAHVVLACRSKQKCEKATLSLNKQIEKEQKKGKGVAMLLDLGDFESVERFSKEFLERFSRLDSLMLNAGIMMTDFGKTKQGIESQIGVNHFGHFYLTHLLLPLLRSSSSSSHPTTLVSVSSAAHFRTYSHGVGIDLETLNNEENYNRQAAYGQSKLANILFSLELAEKETKRGSNVLVNVIHPGVVETELPRYLMDFLGQKIGFFSVLLEPLFKFISSAVFWDSDTASLTQVYASVGPKLLEEKITGKYFHPIARENPPHVSFANDKKLREGLWDLSEEVVREYERTKGEK